MSPHRHTPPSSCPAQAGHPVDAGAHWYDTESRRASAVTGSPACAGDDDGEVSNKKKRRDEAGFTMLEALIATALMGAILMALATVSAQWLPSWNRGFVSVQRNELLALGLERLAADLSAAEFVPISGDIKLPMFQGGENAVVFVRTAIGPNTPAGLEIVRIAETVAERGTVLVRTRAPFIPSMAIPAFSDPVVLLRPPFRVSFAYAGADRVWRGTWRDASLLPRAVRFQVRDAGSERLLAVSTSTLVHSTIPPDCVAAQSLDECLKRDRRPGAAGAGQPNPPQPAANTRGGI